MNIPDELLHYLTKFLERSHPNLGIYLHNHLQKKKRLEGRILCLEHHL